MAKFLSHDGVDTHGVRAEVMVQTGTGRIKELVGRGKQAEDGSYRNVEVVFTPDNPKLVRKVYALLDTTAKDLWELVQAAQADQRDISFRIESQRKRGIERTKKFEDLVHTEEVVRVLAAIDDVFSHEAKTDPAEDPSRENPSALAQAHAGAPAATPASSGAGRVDLVAALAAARQQGLPAVTVDTLMALALAAGAPVAEVLAAGLPASEGKPRPVATSGRAVAVEEKPWEAFNSDGRINVGSYMVAHAATAERFALDHLVGLYSKGGKSAVKVSDEMIAQAASLALVLLEMGDAVLVKAVGGRVDRQKNSYNRCLSLILDAVEKRYPAPVGGNEQAQTEWRETVVEEAAERLYGITEVAQGRLPLPADQRTQAPAAPVAPASEPAPSGQAVATAVLGATTELVSSGRFPTGPAFGQDGFTAPDDELINRLRAVCEAADVAAQPKAVSDWLERELGARATRRVDAGVLTQFVEFYEQAGPDTVRLEVLGANPTAA